MGVSNMGIDIFGVTMVERVDIYRAYRGVE